MTKRKRKTNVELVKNFMEVNRFGALGQLMVMEGVRRYAQQLADLTEEQLKEMDEKGLAINMRAMHEIGKDWLNNVESNDKI